MGNPTTAHRSITYRLLPGSKDNAEALSRISGACRFVWNQMLADQDDLCRIAAMVGSAPPSVSTFALNLAFTQLRRATPWLNELPYRPVRYVLKQQADAWRRFFAGQGGRPTFRSKRNAKVGFTIPEAVRIDGGSVYVPRLGWLSLRRRGSNPYPSGKALQVHVRQSCGKWYATVVYEVELPERVDDGLAVGIDMNVGQVAASTGDIVRIPDLSKLEARRKRYQRMVARRQKGSNRREKAMRLLASTNRSIAMARRDWQHQTSRRIADTAYTVVVEDLRTKGMTASGKGKRGLNREILATGWSGLRTMLEYKAGEVVAVNPAYTSQTCRACGFVDKANRYSQSGFRCGRCGHEANADVNAALNIMASGIGATGRRGASALSGSDEPSTRLYYVLEHDSL